MSVCVSVLVCTVAEKGCSVFSQTQVPGSCQKPQKPKSRPTAVIPWAVGPAEAAGQPTVQKEGTCQPFYQEWFSLHISFQLEDPIKNKMVVLKWNCQQASRFTMADS